MYNKTQNMIIYCSWKVYLLSSYISYTYYTCKVLFPLYGKYIRIKIVTKCNIERLCISYIRVQRERYTHIFLKEIAFIIFLFAVFY